MSVAWVGAGIAAVGVASQAKSASDAADAQSSAAAQSDATQRYFYDTNRADNAPFLNNGTAASNALAYRLGLSPSPNQSAPSAASFKPLSSADLFDTSGATWRPNADLYASDPSYRNAYDQFMAWHQNRFNTAPGNSKGSDASTAAQQLAQFGFDINAATAARQQSAQPMQTTAQPVQNDPVAGSLLRNFSMADLQADPVYQSGLQFGLDEGRQGIERQAAASGQQLSGATLKALAKYGTDYGSTKANESFNRFNANRDSTYNKLAALAGAGQTATAQVGAAGANAGNNISASQIGVGNARGASAIAQGNALTNGLSQGYNMYQQNKLMQSLNNGSNYNNWTNSNSGLGLSNYDLGSAF